MLINSLERRSDPLILLLFSIFNPRVFYVHKIIGMASLIIMLIVKCLPLHINKIIYFGFPISNNNNNKILYSAVS